MKQRIAKWLYFALQQFRGEPVQHAIKDVFKAENASLDELKEVQAHRQLEQLHFAIQHVPYYRNAYQKYSNKIRKCKGWEAVHELMQELPILEKDSLRKDISQFYAVNYKNIKTYPDRTSGSSGAPLIFPCDQTSWAYRHALLYRCLASFGIDIGEPYAVLYGYPWDRLKQIQVQVKDWAFNRVRISAYEIKPEIIKAHLNKIKRHRITHMIGYPSAVYELCVLLHEQNRDLKSFGLKAVFVAGEPVSALQKEMIEKVTGVRCINMYGSAEGGFTAFECPKGSLHLAIEMCWIRLRDSSSHEGELVLTDMMLRACPMINYAMDDEVALKSGQCSCGRNQPMLEAIVGRCTEPILLPNGKKINPNSTNHIFRNLAPLGIFRRFRFVMNSKKELNLFVIVSNQFNNKHKKMLQDEIKKSFGDDIECGIKLVDSLPDLPNAKHRDYVIVD